MSFTRNNLILLGDSDVGKTSVLRQFVEGLFLECEPTTHGVAFRTVDYSYDGLQLKIAVWDASSLPQYSAVARLYYRDVSAAIVVSDEQCLRIPSSSSDQSSLPNGYCESLFASDSMFYIEILNWVTSQKNQSLLSKIMLKGSNVQTPYERSRLMKILIYHNYQATIQCRQAEFRLRNIRFFRWPSLN